jgi:sulfopyruvate decarboxylase TPP-binding subunit
MSYTQALTQNPPGGPSASGLLSALLSAKASHCITVPDFVQFALHDKILAKDSGLPNVFATNENQAITMATGMYIAGANPVVVMQNQGFLNCINTLRGTCIDSAIPMVFLVGQFGREAENIGQPTKQSRRSMVRLLEPLLETLGLHYWNIEEETDIGNVAKAFEHAATAKTAAVLIVSRHVTWQ